VKGRHETFDQYLIRLMHFFTQFTDQYNYTRLTLPVCEVNNSFTHSSPGILCHVTEYWCQMFRDSVVIPDSMVECHSTLDTRTLKIRQPRCPDTLGTRHLATQRNTLGIPKPQFNHSESLTTRQAMYTRVNKYPSA